MVGSPWRWNLIHSKWRFQYWDQVMENRLNFYWPVFISTFRFNISHHQKLSKCVYMINCQITEQHNQNLIHIHSNIYSFKYTPTTHQNLQISPKTVFCSKIEISQTSLGVDWAVCLTAHVDRAFSEIWPSMTFLWSQLHHTITPVHQSTSSQAPKLC